MATDVLDQSFASAGIGDLLPPDGADKGVAEPIPGTRNAPEKTEQSQTKTDLKEQKTDTSSQAKTDTKTVEKTDTKKDEELTNPHLASKADTKKDEKTDIPVEFPQEFKKGMTEAVFEKNKKAFESILASEKKWKTQAEEHSAALKGAQAEIDGMKKTLAEHEALKKEVEGMRKTMGDYEQEASVMRVEGTREYKSAVTGPQNDITTSLSEMAKRYELEPETILHAIREPDQAKRNKQLDDISSDFSRVDQHELVQSARDWQRIQKIATDMRANAGEKLKELTAAQKADEDRIASSNTNEYRAHLQEAWAQLQDRSPFLRKADGNDKWNAYLDSLYRDAEGLDVNNLSLSSLAKAVAAERAMPDILKVATHFQNRVKELEALLQKAEQRIGDKRDLSAGAGGSNGSASSDGKVAEKRGGSFVDSVI